jgi:glycosyltransferase involved in cell wall biosynthesis
LLERNPELEDWLAVEDVWPSVSVIVPTRNRERFIPHLMRALTEQDYPPQRIEVLIIDDCSTDSTEQIVVDWIARARFPVRFYRASRRGPAALRNFGAAHAAGTLLAFTDSDCMPHASWLRNAARAIDGGVGLVAGRIDLDRNADTHFFFNSQLDPEIHDRGLYRTANLVVPSEVFRMVGGFDESFTYAAGSGEDTDLGWRIRRSGKAAAFVPDALVTHFATPISISAWMRKPLDFQVIPRLVALYPEIRSTALFARYFMSPRHFLFDVAVAGLVISLAAQSWPWLLLLLPWFVVSSEAWLTMARLGRLHKAAAIQLLLIERYGLGLGVLLWSSLKYRRLVL